MLNETIESFIASNTLYNELPHDVQTVLGNSQREYDKRVVEYSVRNQLKHKGNIGACSLCFVSVYYSS